jgi:hypothetical protein
MILLFSFSVNQETQEAAFAGNIEPQQAVQILQQIAIAAAVQKLKEAKSGSDTGAGGNKAGGEA